MSGRRIEFRRVRTKTWLIAVLLAGSGFCALVYQVAWLREFRLIFGASYESSAVIPDGTPPQQLDNAVTQYVPSARPGRRAPHAWLERDGARLSTIDLFGLRFVLLAGRRGDAWSAAAPQLTAPSYPPLVAHTIGAGHPITDPDDAWQDAYEIDDEGAVLVRPDAHVAWRSRGASDDPAGALRAAMDGVLGRAAEPASRHLAKR